MTGPIHICRDFYASLTGSNSAPYGPMYLASVFLFGVLNFTQVGQTGFNLSGSALVASGLSASISLPVSGAYAVSIPTASYLVSSADIGRIVALRSDLNPASNSGLFHVTAISSSMNALLIDYRSADNPVIETQTLNWSVFPGENYLGSSPGSGGTPSGPGGYKSRGAGYTGKRIILQSPHSSAWQVRFCYESSTDRSGHFTKLSQAPGFGGDANGDFPSGSLDNSQPLVEHLHGAMWFDVSSSNSNYLGLSTDLEIYLSDNSDEGTLITRFYAWGDALSGSVCFAWRNVLNFVDGWTTFGLVEDDETPAPPRVSQRLFTLGRFISSAGMVWDCGPNSTSANHIGIAFGLNLKPVSCVRAPYTYVGSTNSRIRRESTAGDNVMLGATELQKVDLWAGTHETNYTHSSWPQVAYFDYDPRRMGSEPIARQGRENFATWSTTTDTQKSWFHTKNGVFFPWTGPTPYA